MPYRKKNDAPFSHLRSRISDLRCEGQDAKCKISTTATGQVTKFLPGRQLSNRCSATCRVADSNKLIVSDAAGGVAVRFAVAAEHAAPSTFEAQAPAVSSIGLRTTPVEAVRAARKQ